MLPGSLTVSADTRVLQGGASVSPSCVKASLSTILASHDEEPMNNPG